MSEQTAPIGMGSGLAGRYAIAFFDLAKTEKCLDSVEADVAVLGELSANHAEFGKLMTSPMIGRAERIKAVTAIAELQEFQPLTVKFLGALASNGRLYVLPRILKRFRELLARHRGEIAASVVTAHPLDDGQLDLLKSTVKSSIGQDVALDITVDPKLLGGMIVKVGSRQIDGSLKTKLDRLEVVMRGTR
ncbi:MAG: F0F1 ATP synthase subunit delta [Pseudomonadota bacterium]